MATTALVMLQPVWDCRWSRNGYHLTGVADALQPEGEWVCIREGTRRSVTEEECRTCPHWELNPAARSRASAIGRIAASVQITADELLLFWTRTVLIMAAVIFAAIGFVTLTGPMTVPFTVSMWLCAAAFAGLAAFWRLSET